MIRGLIRAVVLVGGVATWRMLKDKAELEKRSEYPYPRRPVTIVDPAGEMSVVPTGTTVESEVKVKEPAVEPLSTKPDPTAAAVAIAAKTPVEAAGRDFSVPPVPRHKPEFMATPEPKVKLPLAERSWVGAVCVALSILGVVATVVAVTQPLQPVAWVTGPAGAVISVGCWWLARRAAGRQKARPLQ